MKPSIKKVGMKVVRAGAKVIQMYKVSHAKKQAAINKYGRTAIGS